MGKLRRKERYTSFQHNNPRNCRCVPKLNELHVLYHFRVKLASSGSQRIHLKNFRGSTSTYKFWWGGTSTFFRVLRYVNNIAIAVLPILQLQYCLRIAIRVLLESLALGNG